MGLFSFKCRKCRHPLLGTGTNHINRWMGQATIILPDGAIRSGFYDGYGRISGFQIPFTSNYDAEATVYHTACYEAKGSPSNYRGPTKQASDQGHFYKRGAHDRIDPRGLEYYPPRFQSIMERVREEVEKYPSINVIANLLRIVCTKERLVQEFLNVPGWMDILESLIQLAKKGKI